MASPKSSCTLVAVWRVISIYQAELQCTELPKFLSMLDKRSGMSDAVIISAIGSIQAEPIVASSTLVGSLIDGMRTLEPLMRSAGKSSSVDNFKVALRSLERLEGMSIDNFISLLRDQLIKPKAANDLSCDSVEDYAALLADAIHDPVRFPAAFETLRSDKNMKQEDVARIASTVAYPMGKSTKRGVALERIWKQHEKSLTLSAKIDAQRGKSAA